MSDDIEFTDRYQALGIPYPDPETVCQGQCEGVGVYPHRLGWNDVETDYERAEWERLHAQPHNDGPCDGFHFIACRECGGTGKRGGAR